MELSKQEMELFHHFPVIGSKNFFYKSFSNWSNDSKMVLRNRKWNYLNRKWKYFTPFQSSYQKTSLTKVSPIGLRIPKWICNRTWNYLNRKWNYFTPFQSSDQKNSVTKVSQIGQRIPKCISETGNGII